MDRTSTFRKTIFPTAILALLLPGAAFCITAPHLTLIPFAETLIGETNEYVYYQDDILSELVWDLKPLTFLGLGLKAGWDRSLQLSAEISGGIPMVTGTMEDSDWLNLLGNGNTDKTTFSHHGADLAFAFRWSAEAGWDVPLPLDGPWSTKKIRLTPSLGFGYMIWKWNAKDGYAQHTIASGGVYPAWDSDMPRSAVSGIPISYMQEYWMPTLGLEVSIPAGQRLLVKSGISGSLWVNCNGTDNHFAAISGYDFTGSTKSTIYYDLMAGGWMIEPSIEASWSVSPRWSILAAVKGTRISGLRGNTAEQDSEGGTIYWSRESDGDGGGASLETLSIRLGMEARLR